MRHVLSSWRFSGAVRAGLVLAFLVHHRISAAGDETKALVGEQSRDMGKQALAFLPSELWVHLDDSITWRFVTDENHTVTFLKSGQVRPSFQVGCPGTTPDGSGYDGTTCLNSGPSQAGPLIRSASKKPATSGSSASFMST